MKPKIYNLFFVFLFFHNLGTAQNCWPNAQTSLNINNIDARLNNGPNLINGSSLFSDFPNHAYEYPKGSGSNLLFGGSLWMGGVDDQGNLKLAAQTFQNYGNGFFTGPIDKDGMAYPNCLDFNRFWEVEGHDIALFLQAWEENEGFLETSQIPISILEWPGRNSATFTDFSLPIDKELAPFWDYNGDGNYNPVEGDYPVINPNREGVYADQMIWWVFNDVGNNPESESEMIGVEVSILAYAYQSDDYLNNTTFYRYTMDYRGTETLYDFYTGIWTHSYLGNIQDDYIGCDTLQNMGFSYNGDSYDEVYGDKIPKVGIKYLSDWDGNIGEDLKFSTFLSYNNNFSPTGTPSFPQHCYNYMKGFWRDDSPMTFGGNGYGGSELSNFMFSSDPSILVEGGGWSECNENNDPGLRRFVMSMGPFVLEPNTRRDMTCTILVVPGEEAGAPCSSMDPLRDLGNQVDAFYFDQHIDGPWAVGVEDKPNLMKLTAYPNPATEQVIFEWDKSYKEELVIALYNILGQKLEQISTMEHQNKIDVSSWNTGMYFYKLLDQQGQVLNTEKFLVE